MEKVKNSASRAFTNMLTTTLRNHYTLNQMVDRKARIILSLNVVVISLIIGNILNNSIAFDSSINVFLGGGFFCAVSIIFSVLAIIPEKGRDELSESKLKTSEINPLFFGNYLSMSCLSFENTMIEMSHDSNFAHRAMLKEMYHVGKILDRKRKFLRYSVIAMTVGICVSLLLSVVFKVLLV